MHSNLDLSIKKQPISRSSTTERFSRHSSHSIYSLNDDADVQSLKSWSECMDDRPTDNEITTLNFVREKESSSLLAKSSEFVNLSLSNPVDIEINKTSGSNSNGYVNLSVSSTCSIVADGEAKSSFVDLHLIPPSISQYDFSNDDNRITKTESPSNVKISICDSKEDIVGCDNNLKEPTHYSKSASIGNDLQICSSKNLIKSYQINKSVGSDISTISDASIATSSIYVVPDSTRSVNTCSTDHLNAKKKSVDGLYPKLSKEQSLMYEESDKSDTETTRTNLPSRYSQEQTKKCEQLNKLYPVLDNTYSENKKDRNDFLLNDNSLITNDNKVGSTIHQSYLRKSVLNNSFENGGCDSGVNSNGKQKSLFQWPEQSSGNFNMNSQYFQCKEHREVPYSSKNGIKSKPLHTNRSQVPSFGSNANSKQVGVCKPSQKSFGQFKYLENEQHRLEHDNFSSKVAKAWNNFKYGTGWTFKTKSTIKYDEPLFFLGKIYHKRREDGDDEQEFYKHFFSRLWLTYRSNFYPIPGTKLTTDCGWGCMLRSGQMLIAQCFSTHFLGPDWRLHNEQTPEQEAYHREIIRWFSDPVDDVPSDKSPFCLHHLAHFGRQHKKEPGQWYGPSSAAFIFRDAFEKESLLLPILSQLCLYVAHDCTVYIDDILELCTRQRRSDSVTSSSDYSPREENPNYNSEPKPWLRSLIILIPMRLGGDSLNDIYAPCVKKLLSQPNCMGIIGGKPKHSLYFLGYQEDKLIYLDPHFCRDAVDTRGKDFKFESYHCTTQRKLHISKMDPSCTVGFYIKNEEDFWKFRDVVEEIATPHDQASYPMFILNEGSHRDAQMNLLDSNSQEKGRVKVVHYITDSQGQKQRAYSQESEEFVLL